jgi:hypothetical protein
LDGEVLLFGIYNETRVETKVAEVRRQMGTPPRLD